MSKALHRFRAIACVATAAISAAVLPAQITRDAPLAEDIFPQLKPILEKALKQSSQMLLRNIDIAQAEAGRIQANSALLPNASSSVFYTTNTSAVVSNSSVSSKASGVFYSFNISQPLYQWGTLKAQVDSAAIGVKIAEKNFAEAYRLLALSIRAQYTGLVVKKIALRNAEFFLKSTASNLALEEEKLRNGRISQGDIIGPRLALDEATLARDKAEEALTVAIRYFCQLAGVETLDAASIPQEIVLGGQYYDTPYTAPMLTKFIDNDLENTLQAQIYRDNIHQAELSYKIAKYRLFPKFSISAAYSQVNQTTASANFVSQVGVNSQSINIIGSWNMFDGFAVRGAKRSALATKRTFEQYLEAYLRTTGSQVKDQERQLNFASRAMRLADTRQLLQADAVKREMSDLQKGVGTQRKVDDTLNGSYQSDLNAASARADFLAKWAEFLSALNIDPAMENLPAGYIPHGK